MHMYLSVFSSVVEQATPQIRQWPTRAALKRRNLFGATWTFFFQRMKGEEGWVCWVQCGYMWQHCRLWAMQRTELFPDSILFSTWFLQVCLLKLSHGNKQRQTSVLFSGFESKRQDSPKLSPNAIFQRKNMIEQLILVLEWVNRGQDWVCFVLWGYMWQHWRLWAMQRKTKHFPDSILVLEMICSGLPRKAFPTEASKGRR